MNTVGTHSPSGLHDAHPVEHWHRMQREPASRKVDLAEVYV